MNLTPDDLEQAGFVQLTEPDELDISFCFRRYFHHSVLTMPPEAQAEQPWIDCRIANPVSDYLASIAGLPKNGYRRDQMEGVFGALRHKMTCINELHLFMRQYGYTYPTAGTNQPNLLL